MNRNILQSKPDVVRIFFFCPLSFPFCHWHYLICSCPTSFVSSYAVLLSDFQTSVVVETPESMSRVPKPPKNSQLPTKEILSQINQYFRLECSWLLKDCKVHQDVRDLDFTQTEMQYKPTDPMKKSLKARSPQCTIWLFW